MRVQSQPAFLLHARPFRETSLIIEVFSRQYGRVGLLARGVRNPKSRKRALVNHFYWAGVAKGNCLCLPVLRPPVEQENWQLSKDMLLFT